MPSSGRSAPPAPAVHVTDGQDAVVTRGLTKRFGALTAATMAEVDAAIRVSLGVS